MSPIKRFGCSTVVISPALSCRAGRGSIVTDNKSELQIRMLEEQLIEMKIALATSKSREDYLMLECHKLAKRVEDCEKANQELREELQGKQKKENNSADEILPEEEYIPTVAVPTFRPAYDAPKKADDVVEISKSSPPNCIGLAYIDKSKSISMLSFNSSASNTIYEDDEVDFSSPQEYSVPLTDEAQTKSGKVPIPHPASCASGLAFLSGNLRASILSIDDNISLGLDDMSQQSSSLASGFFI